MNGIAEMKAPYTWGISFLLALTISFQPGCNKKNHVPEGRVEKKLSAEFSDTARGPDPFSQEALPATTQSQDDSSRLLRETLIPLVDWPEQPLSERLSLIEREAAKVGISVRTSKALRKRMNTGALIYPELRMRNVPLAIAIRYTCDATILYYELTDSGDLLFLLSNEKASEKLDP